MSFGMFKKVWISVEPAQNCKAAYHKEDIPMPIKNAKTRFSIFVQVIITLVLLGGCASSGPLKNLENDQLAQEQGFQSIVFWRIKVIDRTNSFGKPELANVPGFQFYEAEKSVSEPILHFIRPNLKMDAWDGKVLGGGWVKKDDVSYLDETTIAEIKPGEYTLDNIYFPMGNYTSYSARQYTTISFTIDVDKTYDIHPGKLLYLGEFDVEFVSKKFVENKGNVYSYNVKINQNTDDFNRNLEIVQEHYPLLYNQFKNNADIAYSKYLFFEDFSQTETFSHNGNSIKINKRGWKSPGNYTGREVFIGGGEYVIEPHDNRCYWSTIKFPTPVPINFDIELVSTWKSGVDKNPYGLLLGNDSNNYCQFVVSGNGYSGIFVVVDGKYKEPQPVGWKPNTANKGNGTVANRHKVEVRGNVLNYYVNDKYIGRVNNKINFKNGFIGVFVCDKQKVAFDDLKIK